MRVPRGAHLRLLHRAHGRAVRLEAPRPPQRALRQHGHVVRHRLRHRARDADAAEDTPPVRSSCLDGRVAVLRADARLHDGRVSGDDCHGGQQGVVDIVVSAALFNIFSADRGLL